MMRIMSYNAPSTRHWRRDLYGILIKMWTRRISPLRPIYTHSELVFSDGLSFSSRKDGVGFKVIDYSKHPERWTPLLLPNVSPYNEACVRDKASLLLGKKYDWLGIIADRVFRTGIHDKDKWWCSEAIAHALSLKPELCCPTELHYLAGRWRYDATYRESS